MNYFSIRDKALELLEPADASLAGLSDNDIDIVKDNLSKNHDEILEVERSTRGQASCERWYVERNMRLTGSNIGGVIKRRKSISPKSLLDLFFYFYLFIKFCPYIYVHISFTKK